MLARCRGSRSHLASVRFEVEIEIIFPQIDIDALARRVVLAPELAPVEFHRVAMLRLGAAAVRMCIGKDEYAPIAMDSSVMAARIAGQPGMALRIEVAGNHAVAGLEARAITL